MALLYKAGWSCLELYYWLVLLLSVMTMWGMLRLIWGLADCAAACYVKFRN